jgi:hypothetical protein
MDRLLLSPPGPPMLDTYHLEFLLKAANVLFGLADGLLIYLLLLKLGLRQRTAIIAASIFLLNPAVLFVMSVWGGTETVSLFFVLLSIWFAERNRAFYAWLALTAAAFTRPQMLVIAFILGLVYLRKFRIKENTVAIAGTVVIFFVFLSPFALAISPSLPVDYVTRTLAYHVGNSQADPAYLAVSAGAYSFWTLPLQFLGGQHGVGRMWHPPSDALFRSLTYAQISAIVSIISLLVAGAFVVLRRRLLAAYYFPVLAFGMLAWLVLGTNVVSRYFVYGLVLVILCRQSIKAPLYYGSVALLTAVTFLTSFGHFTFDVLGYGNPSHPLYPAEGGLSAHVLALFFWDRLITLGTLGNMVVLALLFGIVVMALVRRQHGTTPIILATDRPAVAAGAPGTNYQ